MQHFEVSIQFCSGLANLKAGYGQGEHVQLWDEPLRCICVGLCLFELTLSRFSVVRLPLGDAPTWTKIETAGQERPS